MSEEIQFAGVQNTSGGEVHGTHGGVPYTFEKDEIKVLAAHQVQFLLDRNTLSSDGKLVTRKYLFKSVPLTEALKHVKEPENKSVAAAKRANDEREKQKAELKEEILEELRSKGLHAAADRVSGKK
jgi:hypothetical protein